MKTLQKIIIILFFVMFFSPVFSEDTQQDFDSTKIRINAIQATNAGLPSGPGIDQKGTIGYIISRIFDTNGKIGNYFLRALGTRSNERVLRWSGGNGGQLINGTIYDNGTNIGIGATPTAFKLDVNGDINLTGNVYKNGLAVNFSGKFINGTDTDDAVYTIGNVGIGMLNPQETLDISGSLDWTSMYWDGNENIHMRGAGEFSLDFEDSDGNDYWHVWAPVLGSLFTVRNSGDVGIGVNNPITKLDVSGDVLVRGQDIIMSYDTSNDPSTNVDSISYNDGSQLGANGVFSFHADSLLRPGWDSPTAAISAKAGYFEGNVGIGTSAPGQKLSVVGKSQITLSDTAANSNYYGLNIDHNVSGATVLTADRAHIGVRIDLDSNATGGNTSEEHRIYGVLADVDVTGDSDFVAGGHFDVTSNHSSGTIGTLNAVTGYAKSKSSSTVSYLRGIYAQGYIDTTGTVTNTYGGVMKVYKGPAATGTNQTAIGVEGEVEINAGTITNAYGVNSIIDRNAGTITNGYLFRGDYQGTYPTNSYGIYIVDDVRNYFKGRLGLNTNNPQARLHINHTTDASLTSTANGFTIGATNGANLAIDNNEILARDNGAGSPLYIQTGAGAGNTVINSTTGNVGIGTSSPGNKLEVAGKIEADSYCDRGGNNCTTAAQFLGTTSSYNWYKSTTTIESGTLKYWEESLGTHVFCALGATMFFDHASTGGTGLNGCRLYKSGSSWKLRGYEKSTTGAAVRCAAFCLD